MNSDSRPQAQKNSNARRIQAWLVASLAIAMIGACGCSESGPKRYPISGKVTLDGQPLDRATLILTPQGPGRAASANIEAGRFQLTSHDGPTLGTFHIRINPLDPVSVEETAGEAQLQPHAYPVSSQIPMAYQRDGTLQVTITGQSHQQLDLPLSSDAGQGFERSNPIPSQGTQP